MDKRELIWHILAGVVVVLVLVAFLASDVPSIHRAGIGMSIGAGIICLAVPLLGR